MADNRQIEWLVSDMERLTLCKEGITILNIRLNIAEATLTDKDSDLSAVEARLRRAEEEMAKILAAC